MDRALYTSQAAGARASRACKRRFKFCVGVNGQTLHTLILIVFERGMTRVQQIKVCSRAPFFPRRRKEHTPFVPQVPFFDSRERQRQATTSMKRLKDVCGVRKGGGQGRRAIHHWWQNFGEKGR